MLTCQNCGSDNQLGRVFCAQCGTKLDLQHMSAEEVTESQQVGGFKRHWKKLLIVVILLILTPFILAFWPKSGAIGTQGGTPNAARTIDGYLKSMDRLPKGREYGPYQFAEKDLNAYFEFEKAGKLGFDVLSVDLGEGFFHVRAIRNVGKIPLGSRALTFATSYELACVPMGGQVVVRKASIGHLPLVGPMKRIAAGPIHKSLASQKEWEALSDATRIDCKGEKMLIWVKRK